RPLPPPAFALPAHSSASDTLPERVSVPPQMHCLMLLQPALQSLESKMSVVCCQPLQQFLHIRRQVSQGIALLGENGKAVDYIRAEPGDFPGKFVEVCGQALELQGETVRGHVEDMDAVFLVPALQAFDDGLGAQVVIHAVGVMTVEVKILGLGATVECGLRYAFALGAGMQGGQPVGYLVVPGFTGIPGGSHAA